MKSALIAFLMASVSTPAALAQSAPVQDDPVAGGEGEYVVVTAQRREQKLNEVPLAISSLSGDVLEELDVTDITKLTAAIPGISGVAQGILSPIIAIRGVSSNSFGIGGEASVGIFVDEAYIGRLSASSVPFLDVERVVFPVSTCGTEMGL
jgi:iron complex outermembrane receptor protein